jgi:hypothetical protein
VMVECLRVHDHTIDEFDRHNAHNPDFAARLLPSCHSAHKLFASCRAECLAMEPRLGVPIPAKLLKIERSVEAPVHARHRRVRPIALGRIRYLVPKRSSPIDHCMSKAPDRMPEPS